MIPLSDMLPHEGVYTFVTSTGENINIASNRLHAWCAAEAAADRLELALSPVDRKLAQSFIRNNCVSRDRVKQLWRRRDLTPIILAHDGTFSKDNGGPNVMLVDGHHRYVLAMCRRQLYIPTYFLTLPQWKPFQIEGLADITEQALRDIPVTKRSY